MARRLAAVPGILLAACVALAQVDCSNPDNLCTGDPCVIPSLNVAASCVVDFGPRQLEIAGVLGVPCGGLLSLTAANVTVTGRIDGDPGAQYPCPSGLQDGPDVRLFSELDIFVSGEIDASAGVNPVGITLDADRNVVTGGPLLAHGLDGGAVVVDGGNLVSVDGDVDVTGCDGTITLTAGDDARVEASAQLIADSGVAVCGGQRIITVDAGGELAMHGRIRSRATFRANNTGHVILRGDGGVNLTGRILGRSPEGSGRVEIASSAGDVQIGGRVQLVSPRGSSQVPNEVDILAADQLIVSRFGRVSVRSTPAGSVRATAQSMVLLGLLGARINGTIEAAATGNLTASGRFRTGPQGCIALAAGGTLDTLGARFDVPPVVDCP